MTVVVADTGPLNYLVWIEAANLLSKLYGKITLPEGVIVELSHPHAPQPVRDWMVNLPSWVDVHATGPVASRLMMLGRGEREAITLATELNVETILMEDAEGRAVGRSSGLATGRTLAILGRAAEEGLLDLAEAFKRLQATSFRARPEHYRAVMARSLRG